MEASVLITIKVAGSTINHSYPIEVSDLNQAASLLYDIPSILEHCAVTRQLGLF